MGLLWLGEVLFDRADDSRITGIGEKTKRMPEAKSGLQRAGADAQPPCPGICARVVDPGCLPVDDAGQPAGVAAA
jgi:hypothetical protein